MPDTAASVARDRNEEQARFILAMPLGNLLALAECPDPAALHRFAEACRAAADWITPPRLLPGMRTRPVAAMLLRDLASRAEHNARAQDVSGGRRGAALAAWAAFPGIR